MCYCRGWVIMLYLNIIKKNIDQLLSSKYVVVITVYSLYLMYLRNGFSDITLNYWEFVLLAMTDHYYILYFFILSFLFFIFSTIRNEDALVWIRAKNYIRYFIAQCFSFFVASLIFIIVHLIIALSTGMGLQGVNDFITIFPDGNTSGLLLEALSQHFQTPIHAVIIVGLFMIMGMTFFAILISAFNVFYSPRIVILLVAVLYFLMLLGMRSDMDTKFPYIFLNNYLLLHHSISVFGDNYYITIITEFVLILLILILVKKYWYKSLSFFSQLFILKKSFISLWLLSKLISKKNMYIIVALLLLMFGSILIRYKNLTYPDLLFLQFYGHGTGYFNVQDFLRLIIFNGTPIYLFSLFLEKENTDRSSLVTIRMGNKNVWFNSMMKTALMFCCFYVLATFVISTLMGFLFKLDFSNYSYAVQFFAIINVQPIPISTLIIFILSLKLTEILFSLLLVIVTFCITRSSVIGFIILLGSYSLCILNSTIIKYIPTGLSSLSRLEEISGGNGVPYYLSISILIAVALCLLIVLRAGLFKKIFN